MKVSTTKERLKLIMKEKRLRSVDIIKRSERYQDDMGVTLNKVNLSKYLNGVAEPRKERVFKGAIASGQYIAVALFAIALVIIFIADFAHFNLASFGTPKGEVVYAKEMSLFENLPLILLCALVIIFGVWHVGDFWMLVENGVRIMMRG